MSRSKVLARWIPFWVPAVIVLVLLLIVGSLAANAAPPTAPVMGITPTPTETPPPTPTSTPTPTPTPTRDVGDCELVVFKRAEPTQVEPGDEVTFTIEVTNRGQQGAINVQVIDDVHEDLEILEVTTTQGVARIEGQRVIVDIGVIGKDFVVTVVIHTRVREEVSAPKTIENVVLARSDNCNDPTAQVFITVIGPSMPPTGGLSTWWMVAALLGTGLVALSLALSRRSER
jgi:uncharacterized repeat protein (TIGR01451 family)